MKYPAALLISGLAWTAVTCALDRFLMPVVPAACAGIMTAFIVGAALRIAIQRWTGWRWFVLPFASVALGALLFGIFFSTITWVISLVTQKHDVAAASIIVAAYLFPYLALTYFVWATYPASLVTHYLLRRYAIAPRA